jgi:hypothetical protein
MTPAVLGFSMVAGVVTFAVVCAILVVSPPMAVHAVGTLLSAPPLVMSAVAFILRHVR